jgi:hypothetical protein
LFFYYILKYLINCLSTPSSLNRFSIVENTQNKSLRPSFTQKYHEYLICAMIKLMSGHFNRTLTDSFHMHVLSWNECRSHDPYDVTRLDKLQHSLSFSYYLLLNFIQSHPSASTSPVAPDAKHQNFIAFLLIFTQQSKYDNTHNFGMIFTSHFISSYIECHKNISSK